MPLNSDSELSNDDEPEMKLRRFAEAPEHELLPLKIGGKLVRQYKDFSGEEVTQEEPSNNKKEPPVLKPSQPELTVQELILKQKKLLEEMRNKICGMSNAIVNLPQENIGRVKELREFCIGNGVDPLVRETIQKLAIASLTEVFISIIPGYNIRVLTEEEQKQKMKAETKNALSFEISLVSNYQKFLQVLEKNAMKLVKLNKSNSVKTFSTKLGILSTKCLCKLLDKVSHFNFSVNIVSCLIQLTRCSDSKVVNEVCCAFSELFKEDHLLEMSMKTARAISNFVNNRKGRISPQLLYTFLSLKIKNVEETCKAELEAEKDKKRKILRAQRLSRKAKKDLKRKRKIEDPLQEVEAAEKISTKVKLATETMKFIFTTYFRILKRMPTTNLIEPVLEGLAKFAHLINVEFFEDLIQSLASVVNQKNLRLSDSLRCVKTVCIILSHEGQVLNIDPLRFYNALYALLPSLAFQNDDLLPMQAELVSDCVDVLLVKRRRLIPLKRVAAFSKRIMLLSQMVSSNRVLLCLLSTLRSVFIAHTGLSETYVTTENDEDCVSNGIFLPDATDPDCSNSLCTDIVQELRLLTKNSNNKIIRAFCTNISHQVPSSGEFRLNPIWAVRSPRSWLLNEEDDEGTAAILSNDENLLKKKFHKYCSVCFH